MSRLPPPAVLALLLALAAGASLWWLVAPRAPLEAPERRRADTRPEGEGLGAPTLQGQVREAAGPAPPKTAARAASEEPEEAPSRSLRIDVVDALTGRDLTATWNLGTGDIVAAPFGPDQVIDDAAIARSAEGLRRSIAEWEGRFLPSGSVREGVFRPDDHDTGRHPLSVRPPPGYVLLAPPARVEAVIAADVRSVTAVVPLIREAVLDVRVLGPDGRAAAGARLVHLEVGGVAWPCIVEDGEPGRLRIRGIPHLAGERITAGVEWAGEGAIPEPPQDVIEQEDAPSNLTATIPESLGTPWTVELRLSAPTGSLGDSFDVDFDMQLEEAMWEAGEEGQDGSLRLRLLGWDGRPVKGTSVQGLETDDMGQVVLKGLAAGEQRFLVRLPGRLPVRLEAAIRAGQETALTLREPVGGRLEVLVVDEEGRPRPTALLEIRGLAFFDVEGASQRLDLFADHLGRRSIARVEPGEAEIHASWGSRRGSARVVLVDGEATRIRIVAK